MVDRFEESQAPASGFPEGFAKIYVQRMEPSEEEYELRARLGRGKGKGKGKGKPPDLDGDGEEDPELSKLLEEVAKRRRPKPKARDLTLEPEEWKSCALRCRQRLEELRRASLEGALSPTALKFLGFS